MKKISFTIASAALVTASLPLSGGCSKGTKPQQAQAPDHSTSQQAAVAPLQPVAIPPSLQTISFHEDLFGPPPTPQLQGDVSATVRVAEEAAQRMMTAEAARQAAADKAAKTQVLQSNGTSGGLSPLRFPSYDPSLLTGADFDYQPARSLDMPQQEELASIVPRAVESVELELPSTADLIDLDTPAPSDSYSLAAPANVPTLAKPREVAIDSAWLPQPEAQAPSAERSILLPPADMFAEQAEPLATEPAEAAPASRPHELAAPVESIAPPPANLGRRPSQLSSPTLADTREWSQPPQPTPSQTPQTAALPYPSTGQSARVPQPTAPAYAQQLEGPQLLPTPDVETVAPVEVQPLQLPLEGGVDMQVVAHHARMLIERGTALGERGALYSAKTDFTHALRLLAEAQDAAAGDRRHSEALARAWQCLDEAEDFTTGGSRAVDLQQVVAAHRTTVLHGTDLSRVTPLEATQKYFAYAQEQLALAGGKERVAAEALHCLGKTHVFIARESNEAARTNGPLALAMQQAALMVDDHHHGAANELGVLLAKYGQWNDARRVLLHAVSIRPTSEKWHNLAIVHEHLGEAKLAELATQEAELADLQVKQQGLAADGRVRFVTPHQFAQQGNVNTNVPPAVPRTSTQPTQPQAPPSESKTAWKWPWFQ